MKQLVILFTYSYPYSPPTEQFLHKEVEAFAARDDVNLHIVTMGRNVDIKKKYDSLLRDDDREILLKRRSKLFEILSGIPKLIVEFPDVAREVGYLCSTRAFSDISRTVQQYIQPRMLSLRSFFLSTLLKMRRAMVALFYIPTGSEQTRFCHVC